MTNKNQSKYTAWQAISTIAAREVAVLSRTKSVIISLVIVLLLLVGGVLAAGYFAGKDSDDTKVLAVTGMSADELAIDGYDVRSVDDRAAAEAAVRGSNGAPFEAAVALARTDSGYDIIDDSPIALSDRAAISAAIQSIDTLNGLEQLGINPQEFATAMTPSTINEVDLSAEVGQEQDESYWAALTTTLGGISILMYFIILFSANVGGRITSEKSSRIVEIILSTVRPMDLFIGKIAGNLAFGFAGAALLMAVGAAVLSASGLLDGVEIDFSIFPVLLIMFILGMLFFATLYAAAGSLVSRTEDLQSAQMPIMLLIFASIYAPIFGMNMMDSTFMNALAWIPPTSLTMAPMYYAVGEFSVLQLAASWGILLLSIVALVFVCSRIFRNSILTSGSKKSWVKALKG